MALQFASPSSGSLPSPPPSPFESLASYTAFSSLQSGELDAGAQAAALPGAPTLPALRPLGAAQPSASGALASGAFRGATALPDAPTMPAELPLARRQASSASGALVSGALGSPAAPPAAPAQPAVGPLEQLSGSAGSAPGPADSLPTDQRSPACEQQQQQAPAAEAGRSGGGAGPAAAEAGGGGGSAGEAPASGFAGAALGSALGSAASEGEADLAMHPLCPLHDSVLPLDTASLKSRQLAHSLGLLRGVRDDEGEGRAPSPPASCASLAIACCAALAFAASQPAPHHASPLPQPWASTASALQSRGLPALYTAYRCCPHTPARSPVPRCASSSPHRCRHVPPGGDRPAGVERRGGAAGAGAAGRGAGHSALHAAGGRGSWPVALAAPPAGSLAVWPDPAPGLFLAWPWPDLACAECLPAAPPNPACSTWAARGWRATGAWR